MPVTIRGKQEPPSAQKDAVSTPPSAGKVDLKNKLTGAGKGAEVTRSLTEKTAKSTDASKVTGTSTPISTARLRARERRRGRVEVSPEPDSNSPDPEASAGRIKNLAGFWSTPKDEVQVVSKNRLLVAERAEKAESETDSSDSDSDLEELKRAQEAPPPSETIEIEKGRTKSITNMWQNRKEEDLPAKKTPFKLDLQTEEPTVFENEPVVLEGVVRSDDRAVRDDIVIGRPGRIKHLAVNFATNSHSKPADSTDDEEESTEKQSSAANKKTTEEVIERGKIRNVRERWKKRQQKTKASDSDSESDESGATDDTPPQRTSRNKEQVIEQAKIGKLRERWNRQDGSGDKDDATQSKRQAPNRLHSLVTAKEYGVFENEPTVREDVARADDEQPDIISCEKSQRLRRMWTTMDKEVMKDKEPVEKVVKPAKKKEVKQEAEPEAVKPQTTKPQKGVGRLHGAKDESSKPKEDAKPKKGHRSKGREVELEKDQQQQQQQEPEGKGKLQRAFTIATVGDNKPAAPKSPSLMRYSSRKKVA